MNSSTDHQILKSNLDALTARLGKMKSNGSSKCKILQVPTKSFSFQMCSIPLEIVELHNYLGVSSYITEYYGRVTYINFICNKINCSLGVFEKKP